MRSLWIAMARGALVGALVLGTGCALLAWLITPAPPIDPYALFAAHEADLVRLRDLIRSEPTCDAISLDHYETDGHWIDEPTTPAILASICAMPRDRAEEYVALMERAGVIRVYRDRPAAHGTDDVLMILEMHGIVTAGGETDLVWRRDPPPATSGTEAMGSSYVALGPPSWYAKYEWD